jgi:hypothetical protein
MPSVTRIGPSVHLVKLADTRVLRSVASAAVPVGCFNGAEAPAPPSSVHLVAASKRSVAKEAAPS